MSDFTTKQGDPAAHAQDGEWLEPTTNPFGHGCCDCGLYHQVEFKVVDKRGKEIKGARLQMRWSRDRMETFRLRNFIKMLEESNKILEDEPKVKT